MIEETILKLDDKRSNNPKSPTTTEAVKTEQYNFEQELVTGPFLAYSDK